MQKFEDSNFKEIQEFLISLLNNNGNEPLINIVQNLKLSNKRFEIRVSADERNNINDLFSKSREKTIGAFISKCVKNAPIIIENINVLGNELSLELNRIGTNINQIALRANQLGVVDKDAILLLNDIKAKLITLTNVK